MPVVVFGSARDTEPNGETRETPRRTLAGRPLADRRAFLTNDATLKRASVLRVLVLDELAL